MNETITNNEAHVDDLIRRGSIRDADRDAELARLYRAQFLAKSEEARQLQAKFLDVCAAVDALNKRMGEIMDG